MGESDRVMGALPGGTVTLLLADVEGSTRLWEDAPAEMAAAMSALGATVDDLVDRHDGVRPVEQGEGDSFVLAFTRASDAVACALDLQAARTYPVRLRIGIHTGDVELRDEGNYAGPAINRSARLRDCAHGGQTVLSQTTRDIVVDRLPDGIVLVDLGTHRLRDLERPERIYQLGTETFPPLRSLDAYTHNLPVQLTSFIGREHELAELRALLAEHRLVTITGSGGCGKTRLALQLASELVESFEDGVFEVDLSRIQDDAVLATAVAAAIGADAADVRTEDAVVERLRPRHALVILDNCEHVLDAAARMADRLLRSCERVVVLATSREPLGVGGESIWRVPSLPLTAATELFLDRGRRAKAGFAPDDSGFEHITEICRRLDGIPLALELAAARVRVMDVGRIAAGLGDRFRLLSGGSRTSVQRQQTLRASIDWSHDLLTEPDRILFRRLAVFVGSFDLDAAEAVGAGGALADHQVLDQLASLIDKSLVQIDDDGRYRLLETIRQYGLDRLAESGEAEEVRRAHRDHYLALAEAFRAQAYTPAFAEWIRRFDGEIDNLRAACDWSRDVGDSEIALRIVLPLVWVWRNGHVYGDTFEWFGEVLDEASDCARDVRIHGLMGWLRWNTAFGDLAPAAAHGEELVRLARESGDDLTLARALYGAAYATVWIEPAWAIPLYEEAVAHARRAGDDWAIADTAGYLAYAWLLTGASIEQGQALIDEALTSARRSGHHFREDMLAVLTGATLAMRGDLVASREAFEHAQLLVDERGDLLMRDALAQGAWPLTLLGDVDAALELTARETSIVGSQNVGFLFLEGQRLSARAVALLGAGQPHEALASFDEARGLWTDGWGTGSTDLYVARAVDAAIAAGRTDTAREWANHLLARAGVGNGPWLRAWADLAEAKVLAAEADERAESCAHVALSGVTGVGDKVGVVEALELVAALAARQDSPAESARLLAAASSLRSVIGYVPLPAHAAANDALVASLRDELGEAFDGVWAEGSALSLDEAVAYSQRGRGERKRPSSGWASLTPAELDVVRLVGEGLTNKEIAQRLFISPRTVQAHLTHVYTKLDVSSRVALAKEATVRSSA